MNKKTKKELEKENKEFILDLPVEDTEIIDESECDSVPAVVIPDYDPLNRRTL